MCFLDLFFFINCIIFVLNKDRLNKFSPFIAMKMGTEDIQMFYPTSEELSSICSKVQCSQENCKAVFQSTSNLNMHLIKHHKIESNALSKKDIDSRYFCPSKTCPYHKDSKKYFSKLKYLKQHFLKVHAEKVYLCNKCGKKFSTESFKSLHMKNCGKIFNCTCGSYYTSSEAILTHCKRKGKGHAYAEKCEKEVNKSSVSSQANEPNIKRTERFIYPKLSSDMSFPIHYIAAIALSELSAPCNLVSKVVDKGIQTEVFDISLSKGSKANTTVKSDKKRKNSQQTQTTSGRCKKLKISAQTQTNSDYLKHKVKSNPKTVLRKRKKSMETQTKDHSKGNDNIKSIIQQDKKEGNKLFNSLNTKLNLENKDQTKDDEKLNFVEREREKQSIVDDNLEEEKARKWLWDSQFFIQKEMMPSISGRTVEVKNELFSIGSELNLCNKEIDLNEYNNVTSKNNNNQYTSEQGSDNQIFDINRLCNIETQTEIDAFLTECNDDTTFTLCSTTETQTTDDFDSLLYTNMCTQTCEEVDQLFNFNFVHIETQTAWPDLNDSHGLDS